MPRAFRTIDLVWLCLCLICLADDAHAYIDAATGSVILQAVAAALFGCLFAVKLYWAKLKKLVLRQSGVPETKRTSQP